MAGSVKFPSRVIVTSSYWPTFGEPLQFSKKAAAAIIHIVGLNAPPLRLPLGSDAVRLVEQNERARIEADRKWRELSISSVTASGSHKPYFELATDRQDSGVSVG